MTCMQPTMLYAAGNSEVGTKQYWRNLTTQVQIVPGGKFDSVGGCVLAEQVVPQYKSCCQKWLQRHVRVQAQLEDTGPRARAFPGPAWPVAAPDPVRPAVRAPARNRVQGRFTIASARARAPHHL
eukprot:2153348-Rhodomonas_salina.1